MLTLRVSLQESKEKGAGNAADSCRGRGIQATA